jgi:TatA/E family protein of Tat protein translocase
MLSVPDALVILAIIVFIFGGKRISEFSAGLGKGIRDFKKSFQGDKSTSKELEDKSKTEE